MSEVKRWWANWHMQEYVSNENGNYVLASDYDAALARETALREELDITQRHLDRMIEHGDDLQQRLKAVEQWNAVLERAIFRALDDSSEDATTGEIAIMRADYEALAILIGEPTESGASE